ncbi:MAG: type II secretion system minor pseudopilin GspK [Gammaproteobacteria bacterium]
MLNKESKINNGATLLLTLFITSIVSIIGYKLFDLTMFTSEVEKRNLSHQQSFLMVLSLESYTLDYMSSAEKRKSLSLITNRYDPYSPIEIPLKRGNIVAQIEDKSDCFNLNLIVTNDEESKTKTVNQDELLFFKNLLSSLEIPSDKIESISASLIDWIDGDDFPDNYNGAEDFYYSNLNTPYLTSNQYMQNISELRKVKGVTEVIYKKIEPYICALPTNFKFININSISLLKPKILVALSEKKLSDQEAISILEDRPLSGYENIDEFFNDEFVKQSLSSSFSRKKLNAESFYFNLESQIKYDEFTFIMNSRIIKDDEDMKIISRKIGNFL